MLSLIMRDAVGALLKQGQMARIVRGQFHTS